MMLFFLSNQLNGILLNDNFIFKILISILFNSLFIILLTNFLNYYVDKYLIAQYIATSLCLLTTLYFVQTYYYLPYDIVYSYIIKLNIVPSITSIIVFLLLYKNKFLLRILLLVLASIYVYSSDRSAFLATTLLFLATFHSFISLSGVKNRIFITIFGLLITIVIVFIEGGVEWTASIFTGRANIWSYWIDEFLKNDVNFFIGHGAYNITSISANGKNIINLTAGLSAAQFHNSYIAMIANGGLISLLICFAIFLIFYNIKNNNSFVNIGLFYYSFIQLMLNGSETFFSFNLNSLLFVLSFLIITKDSITHKQILRNV
jgi:hypothetical protein